MSAPGARHRTPPRIGARAGARRLRLLARLALLLAVILLPGAARAEGFPEQVVLSVSQPQVRITSSFAGAQLVLFGVAEKAREIEAAPDVVITVRGPKASFVTWRKSSVFGLWVNTDSRTFVEAPAFLSVQSNRPAEEIADPLTLTRQQIGLTRNLLLQRIGPDFADVVPTDPFRSAFLRIQKAEHLYQENPRGVRFVAPGVFRAELDIPGRAPIGRYEVVVKLLRDGKVTARTIGSFDVLKSGFEQDIAALSQNDGLLYGIAVALGSLVVGFIGNLVFRKE